MYAGQTVMLHKKFSHFSDLPMLNSMCRKKKRTQTQTVMVCLICLIRMPLTISDHLRLRPPTLQCHSDAHCISSHNHATPVARLNSDQCLISPDLVPMSQATTYLSFLHMPHSPDAFSLMITGNHTSLV